MSRHFANYALFSSLPPALAASGERGVSVTPQTLKVWKNGVGVSGQNASGQVGILARAVQLKGGVVLSSGFVGTVFQ